MARGSLWIGTSGWHYDHWKGVFYPPSVPASQGFSYYSLHFDTVEINNSFYRVPSAETFDMWRKRTPRGFRYAAKFSQYGTHRKRLLDPHGTIRYFLAPARHLGPSLGPILVQLPPRWNADPRRKLDRS